LESATIAAEPGVATTREAVEMAKTADVDCSVELIDEHPHQALITAGQKHSARVIVVRNHEESPLRGAIIGSTPYKLVQLSEVPVLVVRP
jgi:nucleotide-binding universal stress UspA family protein